MSESHTLGLAVSMAWAIQNDYKLTVSNQMLYTALETSEEALIMINKSGVITQANTAAYRLFNCVIMNINGCRIEDVLGKRLIFHILNNGNLFKIWN